MSHEVRQTELQQKTQLLLQGSLKYVRAAALAAALVPLASVAAAPVAAQDPCPSSGTVCVPPDQQPGTGTPGFWKNHPGAWPVINITVGGVTYTRDEAIAWLGRVGKDKTITMFSSLVPAMLNAMIGNNGNCVDGAIAAADSWMATYGLGTNVAASSAAWNIGEPLHIQMDSYNNGLLCAPHRL